MNEATQHRALPDDFSESLLDARMSLTLCEASALLGDYKDARKNARDVAAHIGTLVRWLDVEIEKRK